MRIPRLRFKEFQDQWKHKKIAEILQKVSRPVDVELNRMYQQIGIRSHGKGLFHKELVSGASLGNKRIFWFDENLFVLNIVFAWEQAVAKTTSFEKGMVASHRFPMYRPKENLSVIDYILYFFLTDKGKNYLELASPGGAGRNKTLGQKNFEELVVIVPNIEEQTKIANFLTSIDEKITQLTQKCDLLAQYKKGVMQQIFSQKLRFKDDDGRGFPEWEKRKLGDIAVFYNGRAYKQSEWETTGLPVIRLQNLTGSSTDYYYSNLKLPEKQYCNNGDLLFMWSATFGPVWWNGEKAIYHYHIWKIETDSSTLSKNFLFYVLDEITEKTKNTSNGSTMLHVTKESIEKLVINLPSLSEQTKIAHFLTAIDGKITQAQTQLDAVKRYKKGLLQQMFV